MMKTRSAKKSEIYTNQVCYKSVCICQLHKVYKVTSLSASDIYTQISLRVYYLYIYTYMYIRVAHPTHQNMYHQKKS